MKTKIFHRVKNIIQKGALLFLAPGIAVAQPRQRYNIDDIIRDTVVDKTGETTKVKSVEDAMGLVQDIVGWVQIFIYIFAVLFIILGAWDYLNSGGEAEKTKSGRNKILYGLVGIAIAVVAGGVVTLVRNFVN